MQEELGLPVLPATLPVLQRLPLGDLQLRLLLGGSNLQIMMVMLMVMVKLEVASLWTTSNFSLAATCQTKIGQGEGEHTRWHWAQSPTWSSLTIASPTPFHKRLLSHSV